MNVNPERGLSAEVVSKTRHAKIRQQQRGIPQLIIDWLIEYGAQVYQHDQTVLHHFTKGTRRTLAQRFGSEVVSRLSEFLNAYVVVKDELVITAGKRYKRIKT